MLTDLKDWLGIENEGEKLIRSESKSHINDYKKVALL